MSSTSIIIIFIIIILLYCASHGAEQLENKLLYQPTIVDPHKDYSTTPEDYEMDYEEVQINGLYGWLIKPPDMNDKTKILLFCHGNGGNISNTLAFAELMVSHGYAVVTFDYSGYGRSTGKPSETTLVRDVSEMITALLHMKYPASRIIVYGHSLGGAVAIQAVANHPMGHKLAGLVVEGTFYNLHERAQDSFKWMRYIRVPLCNKYTSNQAICHVRCPILVVHSQQDEVIKYEHAEKLYELLQNNFSKAYLISIKGSHNNPIYSAEFFKRIDIL